MPKKIIENEPGTLRYAINVPMNNPLSDYSEPLPFSQTSEIVFIESYQNAEAFNAHLNGPLFTNFRKQNLHFFVEDKDKPGWPTAKTSFLSQVAAA